jgi:signal transduction histidine kinase/DNA-binding response OmpR family regulator
MARSVGADRMYIWENRLINGEFRYEQQYEWRGDDPENKTLYSATGHHYLDPLPGWDALFSEGKNLNGPVSSLAGIERDSLASFGICSILAIPVFLREKLWGFVSFDEMRNEKTFSKAEVSILRSGSLLLANAIVRNQNKVILDSRVKQQELMSSISKSFLSKEPMYRLIDNALRQTGEFMGLSRIVIAVPDKENEDCHIVYTWSSSEEWRARSVYKGFNSIINDSFPKAIPETGFVTAICCNDIQNEFNGKYAVFDCVGLKSFIWAPIYVDGIFWGLISVEECERTRLWNESDIQLVGTVSSAIAGAMDRDIIDKERNTALEQAVQASKAKGNFLTNMSHEMRTPMNAIIGMTSIGKNTQDLKKKDYAFEKIENASSHLLGVINDVLDMSKIEANKLELSFISFNFEGMLQKVVSVISFRLEERQQKFAVNIDHKIPRFIVGDDQRLAQVITNLLSNAVKFTPEKGSIRLNAKLAGVENGIHTLQIEVIDTGIGISPEQQAKLFNSFEQAESGTSRKFGGTGLGLVISKRIVDLMGGRIWIESEPGKGSTFAFTIKVEKGHGASSGMLAPGVNIRNMRIMAVDDNPDILEYFRDIMARFGINCDTAPGAKETLALINEKGDYNLYFVDYRLPDTDGIELTRKIRERDTASKVVMISAADWAAIEKKARAAGVDEFLAKPLFPSPLADIINNCLGFGSVKNAPENTDSAGEEPDYFNDYTMLLAEDVDINREIVLTLLEPTGLTIECAENGAEAVAKFTAAPEKYDMVFMDVQMPEMDGYEATRRIRGLADGWGNKIPIVAMTANVFREDVERCLESGMNDHVGKPLDLNDVLLKLRKYLPKRGKV